jgi:signal transduction histidine kinase/CheY-like chemotaxis protein
MVQQERDTRDELISHIPIGVSLVYYDQPSDTFEIKVSNLTEWNPALFYLRDSIQASGLEALLDTRHWTVLAPVIKRVLRTRETAEVCWVNEEHRSKGVRIEHTVVPLPSGLLAIIYADRTEESHLENQIRQMEKMDAVGKLAGGIAHDFNNQLTGIIGFAELLRRKNSAPDLDRYISHILTSSRRSADLTGKLLSFAHVGIVKPVTVSMHAILDEVITVLKRTIDKRIRIVCECAASPDSVKGDASLLQNAILNLAINARDAMPDGGQLSFHTRIVSLDQSVSFYLDPTLTAGDYLLLEVADTGCGIPAELHTRIFEPFFTTKSSGQGTGIGLAAVYGTIKQHKGAISLNSELGRGTEFRLYLPLDVDTGEDAVESSESRIIRARRPRRILLADDEILVREMIQESLEELGYQVTPCANGFEALSVFADRQDEIDLVILDMMMPELGGEDACEMLRELKPDAKVLLASGYAIQESTQSLLKRPHTAFIQKPFDLVELSHVVFSMTEDQAVPSGESDESNPSK